MRKHLSFVQWSGLLVCIVSLLFVSCENIFKGAEIREQFREAIEIANSESRTYYVIVEEGSGKATPDYVRVKKNERFTLMFTSSDEWKFISWEAIDRTTGNVIPDAITFSFVNTTDFGLPVDPLVNSISAS